MGVSIQMRPGSIARSMGDLVNITPGWRSQAASVMRDMFSDFPLELHATSDLQTLQHMAKGASVYTSDKENMWRILADAVIEYGVVTVVAEY